ncbi:hypothetical protein BDZ89DRAFT_277338 [Hymenopellis radicata]|nr:hypothetical protein BDZ89DRAFT_277338 [Hymenopellis radicata]
MGCQRFTWYSAPSVIGAARSVFPPSSSYPPTTTTTAPPALPTMADTPTFDLELKPILMPLEEVPWDLPLPSQGFSNDRRPVQLPLSVISDILRSHYSDLENARALKTWVCTVLGLPHGLFGVDLFFCLNLFIHVYVVRMFDGVSGQDKLEELKKFQTAAIAIVSVLLLLKRLVTIARIACGDVHHSFSRAVERLSGPGRSP